jgi:iron complex transport system ATP-binding protein
MALARAEARRGCAVVAVLHDLTLAARWADRVVLLCAGRVVCCDEPERALTRERLEAVYGVDFELVRGASGLLVAARS